MCDAPNTSGPCSRERDHVGDDDLSYRPRGGRVPPRDLLKRRLAAGLALEVFGLVPLLLSLTVSLAAWSGPARWSGDRPPSPLLYYRVGRGGGGALVLVPGWLFPEAT